MPTAAVVSYRLGGSDGVSVEAAKWTWALEQLGYKVTWVAGEVSGRGGAVGVEARVVPGLSIHSPAPPAAAEVADALADADVVVVENLCSLPLNPEAGRVVARVRSGRPTVLRHHDLPWQRARFASSPAPPDDPSWRHVTINELSRRELGARGIAATTLYNRFDPDPPAGRREEVRAALARALGRGGGPRAHPGGPGAPMRVVLQPTRALARKRVDASIALAESLGAGAVYWLLGPAEDGYGPELARLLGRARCPVHHGPLQLGAAPEPAGVHDAYAACDVVALMSSWEGFGNPAVESATHRRPLVVGPYPVASELAALGFEWYREGDAGRLSEWLDSPDGALVEHNAAVARRHFDIGDLPGEIAGVLAEIR